MILLLLMLIHAVFAVLPDPNPSHADKPILKVTTKTHDKTIMINTLQEVANNISVTTMKHPGITRWATTDMRQCTEGSNIKYYIRLIKLSDRSFIASECRTNINPRFQSILQPTHNVHNLILRDEDAIDSQLKANLMDEFSGYLQFKSVKFNDFQKNMNYDLQCVIDYQQLMQVKFKETVVEVGLEKKIEVADDCHFNQINANFRGTSSDFVTTYLPVNGTFYCQKGKSPTCNRTIAETKNSRYKLPD
ncbi:hypothetical protein Cantr_10710 [Candida viswanathii]|uniref:Uncharacterized protein n=1 Tax=Candida viswanathii TaxID=5486 RepID=A0A367YD90_9ASCO|nr:hypothetical protein Cantr_10710 [Candida viswanathii]